MNYFMHGERTVHPVSAAEHENMERVARFAAKQQRRLEARQRHALAQTADIALIAAGGFGMGAAQALWAGRLLSTAAAATLALACWIVASVLREMRT